MNFFAIIAFKFDFFQSTFKILAILTYEEIVAIFYPIFDY